MKTFKIKHTGFAIVAAILLTAVNCTQAQIKPSVSAKAATRVLPLDPAVRTGKLPNGFTYYIRHNEEPKKRVVMYLANKVGSVLENDDQQGLAHFMEHMNFNGTKNFPKNQLIDYLQKIGVRFGADINAYTSFDETVYQLPLPSDNPEIVEKGLLIMHDWAHGATLDPTEIDKERGVVLEEKRLGKGAQERMARLYYPMLFNNSRYSARLPIGLDNVLNNFKPATIKRYYDDWYRPNLQALIVVGDISVDQIEKEIKVKFADLKNPAKEEPRTKYAIPLTGKNQFLAITDKEMPYTQAQIFIKQQGNSLKTEADFKKAIIEQLFYRAMRERITELSQTGIPPFISATASVGGFLAGLNNFTASVTANPGQLESGFKAIWREVQRVRKYGVLTSELDRAKASYMRELDGQLAEKNKTASESYVKEYLQYFLKETSSPGIDYEYALSKRLISEITVDDLNALVNLAIKDTNRDVLIMAPEKDKDRLPNEATFLSWMKAVEQETITPYKDETNNEPLLKKQPMPGKIVKSVRDEKLDITTLTLSNGAKVVLKKTSFKNNEIYVNGVASGGNSLYPDSDYRSAFAANEIPRFGAGNYNSSQLRKYLAGKQAALTLSIDERTQQVSSFTKIKDLPTVLELLYAHITEPRVDIEQFKGSLASQVASMANDSVSPGAAFLDMIIATQHPFYSPRRARAKIADIKTTNIEKAFQIYKERWSDVSSMTFTIVGSIDTITIKPLIEKYIASLPSTYKNEHYVDLHLNPVHGSAERTVYKGQAPRATVQLYFTGDYEYNPKDNIEMEALSSILNIKVTERLREKESGVYSPQVLGGGTSVDGGWYNIIAQFACAPENVDKLIAATHEEFAKIIKDGPTETDLEKFKAEEKRQEELKQQSNGFWSSYFRKQLIESTDFKEVLDQQKLLDALTVEDVKRIANKYINYQNYSKFVLMPDNGN